VLFKRLGECLDPVGMTAAKALVSVLVLLPFVVWTGELSVPMKDFLLMAVSGIIGIAIGDSFFFAALGRLSPLMLTVLLLTCPDIVTGLMGVLLLREL
jgi:drug/metabolite transporter (DMT)-like permease